MENPEKNLWLPDAPQPARLKRALELLHESIIKRLQSIKTMRDSFREEMQYLTHKDLHLKLARRYKQVNTHQENLPWDVYETGQQFIHEYQMFFTVFGEYKIALESFVHDDAILKRETKISLDPSMLGETIAGLSTYTRKVLANGLVATFRRNNEYLDKFRKAEEEGSLFSDDLFERSDIEHEITELQKTRIALLRGTFNWSPGYDGPMNNDNIPTNPST